jgi:hypothetical protein
MSDETGLAGLTLGPRSHNFVTDRKRSQNGYLNVLGNY